MNNMTGLKHLGVAILLTLATNVGFAQTGGSGTGGDNGIGGKGYESYAIDPSTLPAYKLFVKPLLDNIIPVDPSKKYSESGIFENKTWYLAPVKLAKIDKDSLGIPFIETDTQQLARQSMKEVWIDSRTFSKKKIEDQGAILLHEIVMSIYLLRFESIKEFCDTSVLLLDNRSADNSGCLDPDTVSQMEQTMPAEKLRPLTADDVENIRYVTSWILLNAKRPGPAIQLLRILKLKGFDQRFFNPDNFDTADNKHAEISVSKSELMQILKATEVSGFLPKLCSAFTQNHFMDCTISFEESAVSYRGFQIPVINIKMKLDGQEAQTIGSFSTNENGDKTTLSENRDQNGNTYYLMSAIAWKSPCAVGDKIMSSMLVFRYLTAGDNSKQLILDSLVVRTGNITAVDPTAFQNCKVLAPKPNGTFDDGIYVTQDSKIPTILSALVSRFPPNATCF